MKKAYLVTLYWEEHDDEQGNFEHDEFLVDGFNEEDAIEKAGYILDYQTRYYPENVEVDVYDYEAEFLGHTDLTFAEMDELDEEEIFRDITDNKGDYSHLFKNERLAV